MVYSLVEQGTATRVMAIFKFLAKNGALAVSLLIFFMNQFLSRCVAKFQLSKIQNSNFKIKDGICNLIGNLIKTKPTYATYANVVIHMRGRVSFIIVNIGCKASTEEEQDWYVNRLSNESCFQG